MFLLDSLNTFHREIWGFEQHRVPHWLCIVMGASIKTIKKAANVVSWRAMEPRGSRVTVTAGHRYDNRVSRVHLIYILTDINIEI